MATIKLGTYGSTVTVLATELNSLANGSVSGVSGAGTGVVLDNTTNLNLYADFELIVAVGSAPTVGDTLDLYMFSSLDGSAYDDAPATGATLPQTFKRVGTFAIETTSTSPKLHVHQVPLTPGKMKFALANNSGVALSASGSSVVAYPYSLTVA